MSDKQPCESSLYEVEITFRLIVDPLLMPSATGKPYEQAVEDRLYTLSDNMCHAAALWGAVGEEKSIKWRKFMWQDLHDPLISDSEQKEKRHE